MAGRIRDTDVALVRERSPIADVVSGRVTLRSAGGGSLKGLCPFHDEKSPSFTVSPARGFYHCFGCGVGGDVFTFVMESEMLGFSEAVEWLASRAGVAVTYEQTAGGGPVQPKRSGQRQRLVEVNVAALEFYNEQLGTAGARPARQFLAERGFDQTVAADFGCGFAPSEWDALTKHLRGRKFTEDELVTAGLAKQSRRGTLIDRFRGRLLWPIREVSGDVVGFGARRLLEDDDGPKYLNTPETPIYKKGALLYGLDRAKREIAKRHRAVVVEGYTDVMACHVAGVPTAVATCGTAFGNEHISVLRRLLMDQDEFRGEVVFTFDGDEAGMKAARRAFEDDQRFVAQTFIAISPDGMDPCELRLANGDLAVRDLIERRAPLVRFVLQSTMDRYDLDTVEGRVAAMRACAPHVARLKDRAQRPEYARWLAGRLGMEIEPVNRAVAEAANTAPKGQRRPGPAAVEAAPEVPRQQRPQADDQALGVEREALKLAVQTPVLAGPMFDAIEAAAYTHPVYICIREALEAVGGVVTGTAGPEWVQRIQEACDDLVTQSVVAELAVEPAHSSTEPDPRYAGIVLARLQELAVVRQIMPLKSRLQRLNPVENPDESARLAGELFALEQHRRGLREQAIGGL
ncbi:DNA primase [Fodinicola feengrottensis]|uniref:DNA primase n=1 Tax=Fodinicola feengrottensis TaxID=435914 RepID=A0ABN2JCK1_9ACTN|nr:DNA primase [Fodinicola feengrottensis]